VHSHFGTRCPICASICDPFTDTKQGIDYYACPTCGYLFKSPRHHPDIAHQKTRYDLHENDPLDPGYRAYFQRFLDWVLPQIPAKEGRALDFGSGASDLLSSMLTEAGFKTRRYDPIYYPNRRYTAYRYDLIVSTEVFEHLNDPLQVLSDLADLLTPHGFIALQTQFSPPEQADFLNWYYRLDPTHIGFFIPETFRHMAVKSGLKYGADDGRNKILLYC